MSRAEMESFLVFDAVLIHMVGELTPAELMNIFPIEKTYDWKKYGMKDYFTTIMEALQAYDLNEPIKTKKKADSLLWDYMNDTVMDYRVNRLSIIGELYEMNTGKCMVEEGFKKLGFEIPAYRLYSGSDGKSFMVDNNGRSFLVMKKSPGILS